MANQINPNDPNGTNWVQLGRWMIAWGAVVGAVRPAGALGEPIRAEDDDGTKFAKWQRWLRAIAETV